MNSVLYTQFILANPSKGGGAKLQGLSYGSQLQLSKGCGWLPFA